MSLATYRLKRLGDRDLDAALGKAEQYRALNEPEEAESICRDVILEQPDHQRALRTLGLALTDRFADEWSGFLDEALATFAKMKNEYERTYLTGVAWERAAKAQVKRGQINSAVDSFEKAMESFATAEKIGPVNVPDPILRWNRCVRAIEAHPELVEAFEAGNRGDRMSHEFQHGD
jgi:tetratricopeptide (TPR) repeat protein